MILFICSDTALILACQEGHYDVATLLIKEGVEVNAKDKYMYSALHRASQYGHTKCCQLLLESGAGIEDAINEGLVYLIVNMAITLWVKTNS